MKLFCLLLVFLRLYIYLKINLKILRILRRNRKLFMEEKMKRTCKNCYAAQTDAHPLQGKSYGCELGYQTDGNGKPLEECPKPKSWRQLKSSKKRT